jgi:Zn-dependent protease
MLFHSFDPLQMLLLAPVILFALTFHEFAHAWLASKLGDPTARMSGRVSLNPLRHLDPIGTIAIFLFGFGWAKPVPVNPYFLGSQKRDFALTALAGPGANVVAGLGFGLIYRLLWAVHIGGFLLTIVSLGVSIDLALAAFNLIPIPPLDGSRVVYYLLPRNLASQYIRLEPFGMWIIIGLMLIDSWTGIIRPWIFLFVRVLGGLFAGPGFGI